MKATAESPGTIRLTCDDPRCDWSVVLPVDLSVSFKQDSAGSEMGSLVVGTDPSSFDSQPVWDHYLEAHGPIWTPHLDARKSQEEQPVQGSETDLEWAEVLREGVYEGQDDA